VGAAAASRGSGRPRRGRSGGTVLAVYAPLDIKEILLAARPKVYFTTPHFDGWPAILIRLPAIRIKDLRERVRRAWLERAPKKLVAEVDGARPSTRRKSAGGKRRPTRR
jgi:hypothetical protein